MNDNEGCALNDVLIIGGGFSGLLAACFCSTRGLGTTVIMRGRGGLSVSHGAIELLDRASPSRSISNLSPPHPYALAGKENLVEGIKSFQVVAEKIGVPYIGGRSKNHRFLTATGSTRSAAYLPESFLRYEKQRPTFGSFKALRDFQAHFASSRLGSNINQTPRVEELPLLHHFRKRDLYPIDAAMMFDDLDWTAENARSWKPLLIGTESLALPAVLGLRNHMAVREIIEEILSVPVFEIPTLPPSIPGLRLELGIREFLLNKGVRIIEGPDAVGRVQRSGQSVKAAGAVIESAGKQSTLDCRTTILASGSFLHGGLIASQNGRIREPVFNLPIEAVDDRSRWVQPSPFDTQKYATLGVAVNAHMQPLDIHGEVMFDNLYAVGGILMGADRSIEGSRQGIDIASSYCAVEHLTRSLT